MTPVQIAAVALAWCATAVVVGFGLGRIVRRAEIEEVCIEPGCQRPATHERVVGVTTDHVPAGDPDGFSWSVELACGRHGEVRRS